MQNNMNLKKILIWAFRLILLTVLYFPVWILGSMAIGDLMAEVPSEPGLLSEEIGMVILGIIDSYFTMEWMAPGLNVSFGLLWGIYIYYSS